MFYLQDGSVRDVRETAHTESESEDSIITQENQPGTHPDLETEVIQETQPETNAGDREIAQDISAPADEPVC